MGTDGNNFVGTDYVICGNRLYPDSEGTEYEKKIKIVLSCPFPGFVQFVALKMVLTSADNFGYQ